MSESRLEKILIIDDSSDYRKLIKTFVSKLLPEVQFVELDPVADGVPDDKFNWGEFDVLLLDFQLSIVGVTGLDILHKYHKRPDFPATIMLTGAGTEEIAIRALKTGIYKYQSKQTLTKDKLKQFIIHAWEAKKEERVKQKEANQQKRVFNKEVFYERLAADSVNPDSQRVLLVIQPDNLPSLEKEIGVIGRDNLLGYIAKKCYEVFDLGACNPNITRISETAIGIQIDFPDSDQTLEHNIQGLCKHLSKYTFHFAEDAYKYTISIGIIKLGNTIAESQQLIEMATAAARRVSDEQANTYYIWQEDDELEIAANKPAEETIADNAATLNEEKQKAEKELDNANEEKARLEQKLKETEQQQALVENAIKSEQEEARKQLEKELAEIAELKAKAKAELEAAAAAKAAAEQEARRIAEKERQEAERRASEEASSKAAQEAEHQAAEEARKRLEEELRAKVETEARLKAEAEAKARLEAELITRQQEQEQREAALKAEAEARLKAEAEAKARLEAELIARQQEQEQREAALKAEAEARARAEAEKRAAEEEKQRKEAEQKAEAEAKTRAEEEARARKEAEQRSEEEAKKRREAEITAEAAAKAKQEYEAEMQAAREAREKLEAELKAIAEAKARAEAEMQEVQSAKAKLEQEMQSSAQPQPGSATSSTMDATPAVTPAEMKTGEPQDIPPQDDKQEVESHPDQAASAAAAEDSQQEETTQNSSSTADQQAEVEALIKKLLTENRIIQTYQPLIAMTEDDSDQEIEFFKTGLSSYEDTLDINNWLADTSRLSTEIQQALNEFVLRQVFARITEYGAEQLRYAFVIDVSESWFTDISLFQWLQKILTQTKKFNPGRAITINIPFPLYEKHEKRASALIGTLHKSHHFQVALNQFPVEQTLEQVCKKVYAKMLITDMEALKNFNTQLAANNPTKNESEDENNEEKIGLLQALKTKGIRVVTTDIEDATLLTEAITAGADYVIGSFVGEIQDSLTESTMMESFELT